MPWYETIDDLARALCDALDATTGRHGHYAAYRWRWETGRPLRKVLVPRYQYPHRRLAA